MKSIALLMTFTARRYASAVLATARCPSVCLSVCLSQAGVVSKPLDESSWSLTRSLLSACPSLYCNGIHVPSKIRVVPSGTLAQTLDLEKFRHGTSGVASVVTVVTLSR